MEIALSPCRSCGKIHPEKVLKCPESDTPLDLRGRLLGGRFRLLSCIGAGGMATVWSARNLRVDRMVAIKLIRHDLVKTEETLARFRDEARAAGRIGSPQICEILDLGTSPLGPYMVMELLDGVSLGELLAQEGRLDPALVATIAREAVRGLAAAHDAGIVHRDLTPGNVFIHQPSGQPDGPPNGPPKGPSTGPPNGRPSAVKLMDFGVSKFLDGGAEAETAHGALLGTPEYMSPEQVSGAKDVDERTDIWAMGAILYRTLTGQDAFQGPTVGARLVAVSLDEPTPVSELAPDIPEGLEAIVSRCLTRDPSQRFRSARELGEALDPFVLPGSLPVLQIKPTKPVSENAATLAVAGDPTVLYDGPAPGPKPAGRPWVAVAVAAAALGLGLGGWWFTREDPPEQPQVEITTSPSPAARPARPQPSRDRPTPKNDRNPRPATPAASRTKGEPLPSLDDETWDEADPPPLEEPTPNSPTKNRPPDPAKQETPGAEDDAPVHGGNNSPGPS